MFILSVRLLKIKNFVHNTMIDEMFSMILHYMDEE